MAENKEPFFVHCGKCSHEWVAAFLPLPIDAFVKLGKSPCPMCGKNSVMIGAFPKTTQLGDVMAWLRNGDTGVSSKTIFSVFVPGYDAGHEDIPHDPSDFGRCYRLLKIEPSWRARLSEVSDRFPEWKPFVEAWDELTALYEEELPKRNCPKLYHRMQELRKAWR